MMRLILTIAAAVAFAVPAAAQTNFPQVMPPNTVYGNTNPQSGPGFAVPLAQIVAEVTLLNPPATVSVATNAAALAAATIPANISYIGTTTAGCSLNYTKGGTSPVSSYGAVFNTKSGIYWEPLFDNAPVRACQFGTVADGSFNFGAAYPAQNTVTGTNNQPMLQAALDYAMQNNFGTVCINDGAYRYDNHGLQIGYGVGQIAFVSLSLVSCAGGREAFSGVGHGVKLYPTMIDQCAVSIAGGRDVEIKNISLSGQNYAFASTVYTTAPLPTAASGWLSSATPNLNTTPGGTSRFTPYAAVCVDPHIGSPPATRYPNVSYPAWLNCTPYCPQYSLDNIWAGGTTYAMGDVVTGSNGILYSSIAGGNIGHDPTGSPSFWTNTGVSTFVASSSNTKITNLDIVGFAVGVVNQPNGDSNGDFTQITNMNCQLTVYCISIGNTQSRNVSIQQSQFNGTHTWLTTVANGSQSGTLGGPINNISGGHGYQFFNIGNLDGVGTMEIGSLYAEAQIRLGTFTSAGLGSSVQFTNCWISFADDGTGTGVVPVAYVESGGRPVSFSFKNCVFNANSRIVPLVHGPANVIVDGGSWSMARQLGSFNNTGLQAAVNYTGGLWIGAAQTFPVTAGAAGSLTWFNPTTSTYMTAANAYSFQLMGPQADFSTFLNRAPFTQAITGFTDVQGQNWKFATGLSGASISGQLSSFALSACNGTSTGGVLTANYVQAAQENLGPSWRINLGDILTQDNDGTIYVVTAVGGLTGGQYPITALQQNNMTLNSSFQCVTSNAAALTGTFELTHTGGGLAASPLTAGGIAIPRQVYYCDFTATSTGGANCGGEQSFTNAPVSVAASMDTYIKNGDHIWTYQLYNDSSQRWPYALGIPSVTALSGVTNGTPGTLTLSIAANLTGRFPVLPLPVVH